MKVTSDIIKSCCGGTTLMFRCDKTLTYEFITFMINIGFIEQSHFTKSGIIYIENDYMILQGPLYNTKLTVTCKKNKDICINKINELEKKLLTF